MIPCVRYSHLSQPRPPSGALMKFMAGPRATLTPLPLYSSPMATPRAFIRVRLNVAAVLMPLYVAYQQFKCTQLRTEHLRRECGDQIRKANTHRAVYETHLRYAQAIEPYNPPCKQSPGKSIDSMAGVFPTQWSTARVHMTSFDLLQCVPFIQPTPRSEKEPRFSIQKNAG